jgi:hypothetical protein
LRFDESLAPYFRYNSGLNEPGRFVLRSEAEWSALWRRITARTGPPREPPAVDFRRDMLLVAAMGTQRTTGYTIRIESVIDQGDALRAEVVRTGPGPRCGVGAALTQPVDIVIVPASAKPVRWAARDEVSDC